MFCDIVTSIYRAGADTLVAQELAKYRLDLVGVQGHSMVTGVTLVLQ